MPTTPVAPESAPLSDADQAAHDAASYVRPASDEDTGWQRTAHLSASPGYRAVRTRNRERLAR